MVIGAGWQEEESENKMEEREKSASKNATGKEQNWQQLVRCAKTQRYYGRSAEWWW